MKRLRGACGSILLATGIAAAEPTTVQLLSPEPVSVQEVSAKSATVHPTSAQVQAELRDAFDAWVDESIARWKRHLDGAEVLSEHDARELSSAMARAQLDVETFLERGAKNHDFPKMLFYNEFYRRPIRTLEPGNLVRKVRHRVREATNVLDDGSVPNSSFFTKTVISSYTPERIAEEFLSFQPDGKMEITKKKKGGTSEGIWIKDAKGRKYILIFDPPFNPEMTTSAEYIGSTLMRIAGYHVPKICITRVQGTGDPLYDGRRAVATLALSDVKGGWRYEPVGCRREIRALLVFAAWIHNVDQTEQNTLVCVNDAGVCRHYVIDFGASLGSFTFRSKPARLGWTRLFSPYQQFTQPLYDHGLRTVPWEAPYAVQSVSVGYFPGYLDPDRWQPFYTNMGFVEVSESDRRWAAERIAQFSDEQIQAVVGLSAYTHPSDADHVASTLIQRRDIITRRYLPVEVSP